VARISRLSLFCLLTIKDGKIIEKRAHFDTGDSRAQLTAGDKAR
jgi:predicted ester cyclase